MQQERHLVTKEEWEHYLSSRPKSYAAFYVIERGSLTCFCSPIFNCSSEGEYTYDHYIPYYESSLDMRTGARTICRSINPAYEDRHKYVIASELASVATTNGDIPVMYDLLSLYNILKIKVENAHEVVLNQLNAINCFLDNGNREVLHLYPVIIYANAHIFGIKHKKQQATVKEAIKLSNKITKKILKLK